MSTKNELKDRLIKEVENDKDELIELCSRLIKIPSENPPGDSTEITTFIDQYLKNAGAETTWHESAEKMYNLVSTIGDEGGDGKHLIYCGHSDVVPTGDPAKWDFNPISGEIVDGWLLGRGASDMKAGLGGLIYTFALLKRLNIDLPGKLSLAVVPDEETGGEYGVPWLLENQIIDGNGCLIAEPSSRYNPTIGQKGSYWFKLKVFGEPGHGSLSPLAGNNAITNMIDAINEVRKLWDLNIEVPSEVQPLIDKSKKYMREVEKDRAPFQKVLEHVTVNIGKIQGGTKSNMIPESCEVEVDCRLPFGITQDDVTAFLHEKLDALGIDYEISRFGFRSDANYTSAEDPVCKSIVDNITYATGHEAYGVMQWASSDARHFRNHNIPVLQYGPAYLPSIHGYNEKVKVEDIERCCKVYIAAVIDYLYER
ncbi:succinyl-diaminopimelate desuccinylase [Lentibacillus persicus]|uniref:Probable succinyl-diaminopimelate desuccinylase n=1 Tax=Lentibacillus persicus TaxID=640948 RepID=A0A1I1VZ87_9BACI|nr:ArgE/DapE family deacylase [Lentibacillus persicus]SFD88135.1 succinyl-diaminopimelate desuccinylase [Lentibacillus persicus]